MLIIRKEYDLLLFTTTFKGNKGIVMCIIHCN